MICPKCKLHNPDDGLQCDCGYDFRAQQVKPLRWISPTKSSPTERRELAFDDQKYPTLRAISRGYRLLAYIALVLGLAIVALLVTVGRERLGDGTAFGLAATVLVSAISVLITFLAIAEAILVFLDIEENTRMSAHRAR